MLLVEKMEEIRIEDAAGVAERGHGVLRGRGEVVEVCGGRWRLRQMSMRQLWRLECYAWDAVGYQRRMKEEGVSGREVKRLGKKLHQIGAKTAAHCVLGRWLVLVPGLWSLLWRWLWLRSEEVSATINTAHTLRGQDRDFFWANLDNIRLRLAHSTRQVGEGIEQRIKRGESAESMVEADGGARAEAKR